MSIVISLILPFASLSFCLFCWLGTVYFCRIFKKKKKFHDRVCYFITQQTSPCKHHWLLKPFQWNDQMSIKYYYPLIVLYRICLIDLMCHIIIEQLFTTQSIEGNSYNVKMLKLACAILFLTGFSDEPAFWVTWEKRRTIFPSSLSVSWAAMPVLSPTTGTLYSSCDWNSLDHHNKEQSFLPH